MAINDSFGTLVNDITEQILSQVHSQVQTVISESVNQRLAEMITPAVIDAAVASRINQNIEKYKPDMSAFDKRIQLSGDRIINSLTETATAKMTELVSTQLRTVDIGSIVNSKISSLMDVNNKHYPFVDSSIPGSAIDINSLKISADNIHGGRINSFSSTGIDDKSSRCQVTILDAGTVFENTLYATRLEIKGDAVIEGNLLIAGQIPKNSVTYQNIIKDSAELAKQTIGPELLDQHQDRIFEKLRIEGIDLNKISIGQKTIIDGTTLTNAVVNSQLQTVGLLRDLQTQGETLLSGTLYVSNKRMGVNTMEPSSALSVWDEEVEIGIGKKKQDTAFIGTVRAQRVVIGSNNQNNIILEPNGNTVVEKLQVGNISIGSSPIPPTHNLPKGAIVFNENPNLGGPLGWVSLGDARWANFGIID